MPPPPARPGAGRRPADLSRRSSDVDAPAAGAVRRSRRGEDEDARQVSLGRPGRGTHRRPSTPATGRGCRGARLGGAPASVASSSTSPRWDGCESRQNWRDPELRDLRRAHLARTIRPSSVRCARVPPLMAVWTLVGGATGAICAAPGGRGGVTVAARRRRCQDRRRAPRGHLDRPGAITTLDDQQRQLVHARFDAG